MKQRKSLIIAAILSISALITFVAYASNSETESSIAEIGNCSYLWIQAPSTLAITSFQVIHGDIFFAPMDQLPLPFIVVKDSQILGPDVIITFTDGSTAHIQQNFSTGLVCGKARVFDTDHPADIIQDSGGTWFTKGPTKVLFSES